MIRNVVLLMRNAPYSLRHLNIRCPVDGTLWGTVRWCIWLEEVCHWVLGFESKSVTSCQFALCFLLALEDMSTQLLLYPPCLSFSAMPLPATMMDTSLCIRVFLL